MPDRTVQHHTPSNNAVVLQRHVPLLKNFHAGEPADAPSTNPVVPRSFVEDAFDRVVLQR
jgi:hypothetical protein